MIFNATLTSIGTPAVDAGGGRIYTTESGLSMRCMAARPTQRQLRELGATIKTATIVMRVREKFMGTRIPTVGQVIGLTIDGLASIAGEVIQAIRPSAPSMRVWTIFIAEN